MDETMFPAGAAARADRRYARLVRLAYLVLPATGRKRYRLAIAQRIVDGCVPRRIQGSRAVDQAYAPIRSRVLRQAMRPPRRLRVGLGPRLRSLPKTVPSTPARLAALDPAVRAAYVLRRVESLPRYIVRDQLVEIGVPDAMEVVAAAEQVPELSLPRVVPGPPLPRRSHLPVGVAGVLTVAALVAAQTGLLEERPAPTAPPAPAASPERTTSALAAARPAADTEPRVTSVVFWAGRLPGRVRGRWVCRRIVVPGRPARSVGLLIAGARRLRTGCRNVHGATVAGAWWRAADGRWYFLAATSPRFAVRVVAPRALARRVPATRARMLAVPAPRGAARPPHGRMTVTARRM
jgi:hypothetical protein